MNFMSVTLLSGQRCMDPAGPTNSNVGISLKFRGMKDYGSNDHAPYLLPCSPEMGKL